MPKITLAEIKPLYIGAGPGLTRTEPVLPTVKKKIKTNKSFDFDQTLEFQSGFTLLTGTVDIVLAVERNNKGDTDRQVTIELFKVSGGIPTSIGSDSQLLNIPASSVTGSHLFQINTATETFATSDFIRLTVTHIESGDKNEDITVHSIDNGFVTQVDLPTDTFINLDSVGIHAFPYTDPSAATEYLSYLAGTTVYLRATVSDPFGFADISSVDISVNDPGSPPSVFTSNLTTPEAGSDVGAIAVFETPYTIPAAPAPDGVWSVDFVANEGTEGTVSHSINKTFGVGSPALNVKKTISTDYDPVNLNSFPKAIPNSHIEYTVETTNSGFGYADNNSVSITDPIPAAQTTFYFGNPIDPVRFVDGTIPSGLTLTFLGLADQTDDIDFYSDAACTTIILAPQADASGYDISSPKVSCIGINPKGDFNGAADLINFPSFYVEFTVRLD